MRRARALTPADHSRRSGADGALRQRKVLILAAIIFGGALWIAPQGMAQPVAATARRGTEVDLSRCRQTKAQNAAPILLHCSGPAGWSFTLERASADPLVGQHDGPLVIIAPTGQRVPLALDALFREDGQGRRPVFIPFPPQLWGRGVEGPVMEWRGAPGGPPDLLWLALTNNWVRRSGSYTLIGIRIGQSPNSICAAALDRGVSESFDGERARMLADQMAGTPCPAVTR